MFPGQQGGPLEHVIAGKAVALQDRARPRRSASASSARSRARRRWRRSCWRATASTSSPAAPTCTSSLVDLRESELDGQQAEDRLHDIGITVNRNAVPFDPRPPMVSPGLRVGTPALATRGLQADDFHEVGSIIAARADARVRRRRASWPSAAPAIAERYPLYAHLGV